MNLRQILKNHQEQQLKLTQQMQLEESYRVENIAVQISSVDHQLSYFDCVIEISQNCIAVVVSSNNGEDEKVVNVLFGNVSSVGIQDGKIMVFLEGQQQENDNYNNGEEDNSTMPEILSLINQSQTGTFNLQGNFTLSLDFSLHSSQKRNQVHQIMVGYLKSQQQQEEDNFMNEMISAQHINEDGTINKFNHDEQQDGDDQDEDQNSSEEQQK